MTSRCSTIKARTAARAALLLCAFCAAAPAVAVQSELHAQTIELRGRGTPEHDRYLRGLLTSGDYQLLPRDTLLARTDTMRGNVLVIRSTLRLEGVIAGDLIIVDANVFVRPTARVLGDIRNIGGGLYYSELADVRGEVLSDPAAPYRAERRADGSVLIRGTTRGSALILDGFRGVRLPTYDRVDGLSVGVGAGYAFPLVGGAEPIVRGRVERRFERGAWTGGGELAVIRGNMEVLAGGERTTATNDRWIRADWVNSTASFAVAEDVRDYYAADRVYAELRRRLNGRGRTASAYLRGQIEDASRLRARDPWSVTGSFRSDNIPVLDSRITSLTVGATSAWTTLHHALRIGGAVELATTVMDGDHSFGRFEIDATWAMAALSNHTLTIRPHVQLPLPGTDSLPYQRWSHVGGPGTLYTFDTAEFRGDRVVFIETEYSIPLPEALRVPVLGRPSIEVFHATGMAWTESDDTGMEQNIGARLRFSLLYLRAVTNPSRFSDDAEFSIGVAVPRRAYPWQD